MKLIDSVMRGYQLPIIYMHWAFSEQDMAAMKRLRAAFCPDAGFNPGNIFPDEAQPHRESELHKPVPQASGMYV